MLFRSNTDLHILMILNFASVLYSEPHQPDYSGAVHHPQPDYNAPRHQQPVDYSPAPQGIYSAPSSIDSCPPCNCDQLAGAAPPGRHQEATGYQYHHEALAPHQIYQGKHSAPDDYYGTPTPSPPVLDGSYGVPPVTPGYSHVDQPSPYPPGDSPSTTLQPPGYSGSSSGDSGSGQQGTGAVTEADATLRSAQGVNGVIHFTETPEGKLIITGTVAGLTPGQHGFHIHEKGDLRNMCKAAGPHYNPFNNPHGGPQDSPTCCRHAGDFGNILADQHGVAVVHMEDHLISLTGRYSVMNRAVVVHEKPDDLGKAGNEESTKTGNAGGRIACGIIKPKQDDSTGRMRMRRK